LKVGTGGYASEIASGVFRAVNAIAGEIRLRYVIRYIPEVEEKSANKIFRKIEVTVPNYPTLKVRARNGYYAANP